MLYFREFDYTAECIMNTTHNCSADKMGAVNLSVSALQNVFGNMCQDTKYLICGSDNSTFKQRKENNVCASRPHSCSLSLVDCVKGLEVKDVCG